MGSQTMRPHASTLTRWERLSHCTLGLDQQPPPTIGYAGRVTTESPRVVFRPYRSYPIGAWPALLAARSEEGEAAEGSAHAFELTHLRKPRPAHELRNTPLEV